jgi:hypothetical protein
MPITLRNPPAELVTDAAQSGARKLILDPLAPDPAAGDVMTTRSGVS